MRRLMDAEEFWSEPELVAAYDDDSGALPYEEWAVNAAARSAAGSGQVSRIEVVGIGAGRELAGIRSLTGDAQIRATDISAAMVDACRARVSELRLTGVEVEQASVEQVGVGARTVDVVVALGAVLGYGADDGARAAALGAVATALRPGGTLAAVVQQRYGRPDWAAWFGMRAALHLVGRCSEPGNRTSRHGSAAVTFHHYTRAELRRLLSGAELEVVELMSLRQWSRERGGRLRMRSPNPLIVIARRIPAPAARSVD